jgi:hypothetical protein
MILCSLELHISDAKKPSYLSLSGVSFYFQSFLFNSHQIKPPPISSFQIVYLFIFGLCFVFSFSFQQLKLCAPKSCLDPSWVQVNQTAKMFEIRATLLASSTKKVEGHFELLRLD